MGARVAGAGVGAVNKGRITIPDDGLPPYMAHQQPLYPRINGLHITGGVLFGLAMLYTALSFAALSRGSMDSAGGGAIAVGILTAGAAAFWMLGHIALRDKRRKFGFKPSGWPSLDWRIWLTVVVVAVAGVTCMAILMLNFPVGSQAAP